MSLAPTISFGFSPSCQKFSCCCCCSGDDDDSHAYPTRSGKFRLQPSMSSKEIKKANERFEQIIRQKLEPLPLDNNAFLERLVTIEGVDLTVSQHNPLTKERLDTVVDKINEVLKEMEIV